MTALFLFCCSSLSGSGKQEENEATTKSEVTISGVKKMEIIPNLPPEIFIDLRVFPTPYEKHNYTNYITQTIVFCLYFCSSSCDKLLE